MSRSRKSTPISKDNPRGAKNDKRLAAHRVRNIPVDSEESETLIHSPSAYKKINQDTYDIHDYICRWSEAEARSYWREVASNTNNLFRDEAYNEKFLKDYPTEEDYINKCWKKYQYYK